ncbi:MAG: DUF4129 domain-containing protein [Stackebrandtia sp.]
MTYGWTQFVAGVADWFPGGVYGLGLAVLLLALAVGLAIQPRGALASRLRRDGASGKPKPKTAEVVVDADVDEELPELPSDELVARAQQFAAAGDYRSAVREWLRVMVRDLVEAGVIEHKPGWTVTELAAAAGLALPPAVGPLDEAARVFSEIWYAEREAGIAEAARMRDLRVVVFQLADEQPAHVVMTVEAVHD